MKYLINMTTEELLEQLLTDAKLSLDEERFVRSRLAHLLKGV